MLQIRARNTSFAIKLHFGLFCYKSFGALGVESPHGGAMVNKASKQKQEAQTQQLRDDEQAQLAADETFFAETKAACQSKATQWAERTRLRTEELQGMRKAIDILTSQSAQKTFVNATTTLLQVSSVGAHHRGQEARTNAISRLQSIVQKYHSLRLAKVAVTLQTGGHFDKVIVAIDQMMGVLRKEEQDDIAHRDRCQVSTGKNTNDMATFRLLALLMLV